MGQSPIPTVAQVQPLGIRRLYQSNLLALIPSLDLLFACNRIMNPLILLEVHQPVLFVFVRVSFVGPVLVLPDSTCEIAGDADVGATRETRHDVNEILLHLPALLS